MFVYEKKIIHIFFFINYYYDIYTSSKITISSLDADSTQ